MAEPDDYESFSKEELIAECRRLAKMAKEGEESDDDLEDDDESVAGDDPWSMKYQELKQYNAKNGDCKVPKNYGPLGSWVDNQRTHYRKYKEGKKSSLSADRIDKLNRIGMHWGKKFGEPKKWEDWAGQLEERVHGFGVKPKKIAQDTELGKWTFYQRKEFRKWKHGKPNALTDDQAKRLKDLGL